MKKRIITLLLAVMLVMSLSVPALAADTQVTAGGGTGQTAVSYTVASTYTVTIPEAVTIGENATISVAANPMIPHDKSILVKLTTCDFTLTYGGDDLTYTITDDSSQSVVINATVLTHAAGTLTASSKVLSFALAEGQSAKYAGKYEDSITFTVSIG